MKKFILVSIFIGFFSCNNVDLPKPNIIIIYADDLGYGDVSSYGLGTLQTPNIDKIANDGIRFTNGYASSATCSPSRYALMTGTYPWRNKNAKILTGANLIIDTTEMTLPKMFKNLGENGEVDKKRRGTLAMEAMLKKAFKKNVKTKLREQRVAENQKHHLVFLHILFQLMI